MKKDKLLSLLLLSYYSGDRIAIAYHKLKKILDDAQIPFELIVMDDGSKDESYEKALTLEKQYNNVHSYQLSRNYTSHYSWFAALSVANGDCCFAIPDDEQMPYTQIVDLYHLWENGAKIVIPYRETRDDPWKSKIFANLYYRLMNALSDINYPLGGADAAFLDREVVDIIVKQIHPINTAVISEVLRLGFDPVYVPFHRVLGLNGMKSRWTFKKKVKLAKDTFFSASTFPIRLITWMGYGFSILAFIMGIFYVYVRIWGNQEFWGVPIPGWTFLIVLTLLIGGLVLFSLGMIAEYIWRIYEEVKGRPGYIIRKKNND